MKKVNKKKIDSDLALSFVVSEERLLRPCVFTLCCFLAKFVSPSLIVLGI